jgi:hypothetical protein
MPGPPVLRGDGANRGVLMDRLEGLFMALTLVSLVGAAVSIAWIMLI